jgi:hypothetical protein
MMLAAAKSNPEFPGASRMVHLQGILSMLIAEIVEMSMTSIILSTIKFLPK